MVYIRGMWVVVDGKVGIGAEYYDGIADIHFVNEIGETYDIQKVPYDQIRIAKYSEIPENRRPSEGLAKRRGYL